MSEIIEIEEKDGIVKFENIINDLTGLEGKINQGKNDIAKLHYQLKQSKSSIEKAKSEKDKKVFVFFDKGISNEGLFNLIVDSDRSYSKTFKRVSDLISSGNNNMLLLSKMIGSLAMLSGLSFEKIMESTDELKNLSELLEQSSDVSGVHGDQINRILKSHINKLREEKQKHQKIEFNFRLLNDRMLEIESENSQLYNKIDALETSVNNILPKENLQDKASGNEENPALHELRNIDDIVSSYGILKYKTNFLIITNIIMFGALVYLFFYEII
ncbi:hypothetical protein [Aestuariibaculum marinum]|uniref:Uncharacterized protein n=1 Tax=Aestuariibaculum marinum TaxID=2683592 RepID=A0A8J6UBS4_9FLAO|nr:hypothetical protein [Aestuariibaculum marinum]MBD0824458.1 hypothetical protein [Aestuariibaculum marinum]